MRYLITTILLTLAPLSSGEDVYYCAEDHRVAIHPDSKQKEFVVRQYPPEKFNLRYEKTAKRITIQASSADGETASIFMDCDYCNPETPMFNATGLIHKLAMKKNIFFISSMTSDDAVIANGTCTKL
ncbi:MAG: hypothetical protein ACJ0RG_12725 [Candidatus Azotimanducaceae bacterium]|jgi:hypothetical protein